MDKTVTPSSRSPAQPPAQRAWYSWRRWGWNFLTLSILAHILFGVVAAYFIVATIQGKKNQFQAPGAKGPNAPTRALEHKVSMAKKQSSMSAPVAAKRITTTGLSKVSLPSMPTMPRLDNVMPAMSMSGMGGSGIGLTGSGHGGGGDGGGGGGGGLSIFGSRTAIPGLVGTFYDLKQNVSRQDTGMTPDIYAEKVTQFARANFNTGLFLNYYKAQKPIYATHVFTPNIPAELGPAAFGVEKEVKPRLWLVHYKGTVIAPETGTFHFVGVGDDVMIVRFNNQMVLDSCWTINTGAVQGETHRFWDWPQPQQGIGAGPGVQVQAGQPYPIEILIGEQPGGYSCAELLMEKEGETYAKDGHGSNILPFFRTVASTELPPPPEGAGRDYPPHAENGPYWKVVPPKAKDEGFSVFN